MKKKQMLSVLLAGMMAATMLAGCGSTTETETASSTETDGKTTETSQEGGVKEFTAFFATAGTEINDDNEIQQIIADKTGVKVKETWLTGQTPEEAVGTMIAGAFLLSNK